MILIAVCVVQFMVPFMLTSIGIALPTIGRAFKASAMQLGLVEQLYLLSLAMTMLTFGRLGDIAGQRRVFISGLLVFTLFTLSLGFVGDIRTMMILRFFQGTGAAMMLSGSMAIVAAAYPPELRTRKIAIVSACTYTGLSLGPVIGGHLTLHYGWRSIFLMAAPIGLIAIISSLIGMKRMENITSGEPIDWKGSLIYALSVGLIMSGAAHAKTPVLGLPMIGAGIAGALVFFHVEKKSATPLLDMSLLVKNRFFTLSSLAALGNYAATFGITFMMSLFLQYGKGLSPKEAGFILIVQPVMQIITSLLAGALSIRFENTRLATAGMLICAAGLLLTAVTLEATCRSGS
jgi:MFS family permease